VPTRTAGDEAVKTATGKTQHAARVSRWLRDRMAAGERGVVLAVQRRACHVAVDDGTPLVLSGPGVPLAPNALTLAVGPPFSFEQSGFRVGQAVALGARTPPERDVDWRVAFGGAATWEPRPRVHRVDPRDLADRLGIVRTTVVGEGKEASLLPLLWMIGSDGRDVGPRRTRIAGPAARLLCDAALRGDAATLTRAARGLAGLGPGRTPSGDDLLGGFAAAWTLVGEALGVPVEAGLRVTEALRLGAEGGASPLGRAWLAHACRGELWEPMTEFVGLLLSAETRDPGGAVRSALAVGSSSGTDWMVGFLLGASAALDRTRASR
jgi:hypothetical protein